MKRIVIYDLDNCISDDRHRRHLIPDWDAYHAGCKDDTPENFLDVQVDVEQKHEIIFITGRMEFCRDATEIWLAAQSIRFRLPINLAMCDLIMRGTNDYRPAPELKGPMAEILLQQYEIVRAYDDREDNLQKYRDLGIEAVHLSIDGAS